MVNGKRGAHHRKEVPGVGYGGEAGPAQGPQQATCPHGAPRTQERTVAVFVSRVSSFQTSAV